MKYLIFSFIAFISVNTFSCEDAGNNESNLPFVMLSKSHEYGMEVLVFFPKVVDGAELTGATISVKDSGGAKFAIYPEVLSPKDYGKYEEFEGAGIIDFAMQKHLFKDAYISAKYSYPPDEDGVVMRCGPYRGWKLSDLPRKTA